MGMAAGAERGEGQLCVGALWAPLCTSGGSSCVGPTSSLGLKFVQTRRKYKWMTGWSHGDIVGAHNCGGKRPTLLALSEESHTTPCEQKGRDTIM